MQTVWTRSLGGGAALQNALVKSQRLGHTEPRPFLARLSLFLLNSVCFESDLDCVEEIEGHSPIPSGHALGYSQALPYDVRLCQSYLCNTKDVFKYLTSDLIDHRGIH